MSRFAATLLLGTALSFGAQFVGAGPAGAAPTDVVAKVNDKAITEADVAAAQSEMEEALSGLPEESRKAQLIDYLVTLQLLSDEAKKQKLDSGPLYEKRLAFAKDKMLMEMVLRDKAQKAVSPEAIKAFYDERLKSVKPEQEVRARHILVPTEEEAKKAVADINAGKSFEETAKAVSKDPGSAKEGGDLGYFTKDRMVPEFANAAFAAEKGKVIQTPVKSQFGWHVIKVEDKRMQPAPELSAVEPQIKAFLVRKNQAELVEALRKQAKIEKTAPPVTATPAAAPTGAPAAGQPKPPSQ